MSTIPDTDTIRERLATNEQWALRGLLAVFHKQTEDERKAHNTIENNGVGFTGWDAEILTSFAYQYIQRRSLSPKQMKVLHKRMPKYAAQLHAIATEKAGVEA